MKQYKVKPEYLDNWLAHGDSSDEVIVDENEINRLAREWGMTVDELMEQVEEIEQDEISVKISRIAIKSETFCTNWNGHLYCVDICEDSEERSAWLYRSDYGTKGLMWGEEIGQQGRDSFIDLVFSNLPEYIENYEEAYGA